MGWRPRPGLVAALVLALAVAALLSGPLLHGLWFLPGDESQLTGALRTEPPSFLPHNIIFTDPATQMDPWLRFTRDQVRAGHLPLWSPDTALGLPVLANMQSATLSPFTLPFYLFPLRLAFALSAGLKLWSLGWFTWLLLRRHGLSQLAALTGALAFSFSGYQLLWLDWSHVGSGVLLPAGAWAVTAFLQASTGRGRRAACAGLSAAFAAGLLAGHAETALFCALAVMTYAAVAVLVLRRGRGRVSAGLSLAAAAALGIALSAVQLLPFLEYLQLSSSFATRTASGIGGGLQPASLGLLAFPDLAGNQTTSFRPFPYLFGNYNEANGAYVGLVALGLACIGATTLGRRRRRRRRGAGQPRWLGAWAVGMVSVGAALLYVPAVARLLARLPGTRLAVVSRSQDVWLMGVAVLAALGVQQLVHASAEAQRAQRGAAAAVAEGALGLAGAASVAGWTVWRRVTAADPAATRAAQAHRLVVQHVAFLLGLLVLAAAVAVLLALSPGWLRSASPGRRVGLTALLPLAVWLSTAVVLRAYNPALPARLVFATPADYTASAALTGRALALRSDGASRLPSTTLWVGGGPMLTGYDALGIRWYNELFARTMGLRSDELYAEGSPRCVADLRLFGVQWVVTARDTPFPAGDRARPNATTTFGPDLSRLVVRQRVGDLRLLPVPQSPGLATVEPRTTVAATAAAALDIVSRCPGPVRRPVVLLAAGSGAPGAVKAGRQSATPSSTSGEGVRSAQVVQDEPGRLRVQVGGAGGELVVRRTWFPGWRAIVDGTPRAIDRADYAFQGVPVPPGQHQVELIYRPASLRLGLLVSVTALLALLVLLSPPLRARHGRHGRHRG